jgi:hypothetical protein
VNGQAVANVTTDSKNPLVGGGPAINNTLTITANNAGAIAVSGSLDGLPSVSLTATRENGKTVNIFNFDPRTVGNGPFSLIDRVGDQDVNMRCAAEGKCNGTIK